MADGADPLAGREIILELIDYGEVIRVTAVDAVTGLEAAASGPRTAARADLERLALGKLARRIEADAPLPDEPTRLARPRGWTA